MENGTLSFLELTASGGLNPRHSSLNSNGSVVAVANQASRSLVIWCRDIETDKFGAKVAGPIDIGPDELT